MSVGRGVNIRAANEAHFETPVVPFPKDGDEGFLPLTGEERSDYFERRVRQLRADAMEYRYLLEKMTDECPFSDMARIARAVLAGPARPEADPEFMARADQITAKRNAEGTMLTLVADFEKLNPDNRKKLLDLLQVFK